MRIAEDKERGEGGEEKGGREEGRRETLSQSRSSTGLGAHTISTSFHVVEH